jgi:glycosyltransferase involved in cell wall biosynthesis
LKFLQIVLLRALTFVLRIPFNTIFVNLSSYLIHHTKPTHNQRIGIDAQILQFRSAKRGIGNYCYRLLNEFPHNGEVCLVLTSSGHVIKTIKIVRFAIEHNMRIKIISPGLITPWDESSTVLNEVTANWQRGLDGIDFDSILHLAPLALPHEVLFDFPGLESGKSRYALYYDNFMLLDSFFWKNLTFKKEITRRLTQISNMEEVFCISDFAKSTLPIYVQAKAVTLPRPNPNGNLQQGQYAQKGFLVVSKHSAHKNLGLAIDAFNLLSREDRRDNPLKIVGITGKTLYDLAPSPTQREFVKVKRHLMGRKMKVELQSCKLIIIPSLMEGLGLLALEGLEFGNLVTCSDLIPARDYIVDKSLLFEHNNATALSIIMKRVIHDSHFTIEMRSTIPKKILESRVQPAGEFIFERISG